MHQIKGLNGEVGLLGRANARKRGGNRVRIGFGIAL